MSLYMNKLQALKYRQFRPEYPKKIMDFIMNHIKRTSNNDSCHKTAGNLAIDCGCGSGQFTRLLSPHYENVIGSDYSPAQINQAIHSSVPKNITFIVALADQMPVLQGTVDLVTVAQAIHWFNIESFYDECRRILKPPNGLLAIIRPSKLSLVSPCDKVLSSKLTMQSDEMYNFLRPYMDSRSQRTVFDWDKFDVPFQCTRNKSMTMQQEINLDYYLGYVSSSAAFNNYLKAVPNGDFLDMHKRDMINVLRTYFHTDNIENIKFSMMFKLDTILANVQMIQSKNVTMIQ